MNEEDNVFLLPSPAHPYAAFDAEDDCGADFRATATVALHYLNASSPFSKYFSLLPRLEEFVDHHPLLAVGGNATIVTHEATGAAVLSGNHGAAAEDEDEEDYDEEEEEDGAGGGSGARGRGGAAANLALASMLSGGSEGAARREWLRDCWAVRVARVRKALGRDREGRAMSSWEMVLSCMYSSGRRGARCLHLAANIFFG